MARSKSVELYKHDPVVCPHFPSHVRRICPDHGPWICVQTHQRRGRHHHQMPPSAGTLTPLSSSLAWTWWLLQCLDTDRDVKRYGLYCPLVKDSLWKLYFIHHPLHHTTSLSTGEAQESLSLTCSYSCSWGNPAALIPNWTHNPSKSAVGGLWGIHPAVHAQQTSTGKHQYLAPFNMEALPWALPRAYLMWESKTSHPAEKSCFSCLYQLSGSFSH